MTEDRRTWMSIWVPTVTTVGACVTALAGAWSGCTDVTRDIRALRTAVEAQTMAVDRMSRRVDAIEVRADRAAEDARRALERLQEPARR